MLLQALSDEIDIDSLLETDETLSFRREGISLEVVRKLRRGHWALQGQLDLHGLRRDEASATSASEPEMRPPAACTSA